MLNIATSTIILIDDHDVVRRGLQSALVARGAQEPTQARSYSHAMRILRKERFDIAIIDRSLGDGDGIDLTSALKRIAPTTIVALLSVESRWSLVERARSAGASAFYSKSAPLPDVLDSIDKLLQHPQQFIVISDEERPKEIDNLTGAEKEILSLISTGATTEEIALFRHNSVATIKSHLTSIYRKLGVRNRVEAIAKAGG